VKNVPTFRCVSCKGTTTLIGKREYDDTIQCDKCGTILRLTISDGEVTNVSLRKIEFKIPGRLPKSLRGVLNHAVRCFEVDVHSATFILARVFTEGLLKTAGMTGGSLKEKIDAAHRARLISDLSYHAANASRLTGNMGAHDPEQLANLRSSDCRRVLELVRDLAEDMIRSGRSPGKKSSTSAKASQGLRNHA
jgi:hypothetical protein